MILESLETVLFCWLWICIELYPISDHLRDGISASLIPVYDEKMIGTENNNELSIDNVYYMNYNNYRFRE